MKKIKSILIGILLLLSILAVMNPVSAATREVGPGKAYTTINGALAAAGVGDTILVYPGTYDEYVNITVPNLTLKSVAGRNFTVIGPGTDDDRVININSGLGTITIDGFTILCPIVPLPNGIIQSFAGRDGTTGHILNNKIIAQSKPFKNAIQLTGDNSRVIGNIVEGETLDDTVWSGTGINIYGTKSIIKDNQVSGSDFGISIAEYATYGGPPITDTVIENNILEKCAYAGVYIRGNVTNTLIKNNIIENNPRWGIRERHYDIPQITGDPCGTKVYFNFFCNNGIDMESTSSDGPHHPNCKLCEIEARGNTWCKPELPMDQISKILKIANSKTTGEIIDTNCIENPESEGCMPQ